MVCLLLFLFSDQRSDCVTLRLIVVDTPEGKVVVAPSQAAAPPMLVVLVKLALSDSAPIASRSWTPMLMLLKEDAVALSCTIYQRSRLIVLLNLSTRSC